MTPKPGYMTTEFWLTMGGMLVSLLAVWFGLSSEETDQLQQCVQKMVVAGGTLATGAVMVWRYIASREHLKTVDWVTQVTSDARPHSFGFGPKAPPEGEEDE